MKDFLFKMVAAFAGSIVSFNVGIGNAIASFVAYSFNSLNSAITKISEYLLLKIDKDRYVYITTASKQLPELTELNLLMAATKVKEDAINSRAWTIGHTIAINKIGNALYSRCNWEPARVHKYLKSVIESIPGMVYMSGDDFDDKSAV